MSDEKKLSAMEALFLALADKTRLRLLNLMRDGEICVCFFVEVLNESQPKISRHLAYLRGAGIVEARRDGKWMHYRIIVPKNDFAAQVLRETLVWLDSQEKMQGEYKKLTEVCCSLIKTTEVPKENAYGKSRILLQRKQELETFLL